MSSVLTSLRRSQAGFALIEALISAAVLATAALAVLAAIDATARSTGREKARSAAVTLAEQDQERLRAMRAKDLEGLDATAPAVTLDGVTYTVRSKGEWIRDDTGGTQSCTNNDRQVDYLKITSTVTSNKKTTKPVTLTSLVAPPPAAPQGTLVVQVLNRDDGPVTGLSVALSGTASATATTNSVGCAIFPRVAKGPYTITLDDPTGSATYPWVDKAGRTPNTRETEVETGAVRSETMYHDQSGRIPLDFDTTDQRSGASTVSIASKGTSVRVAPPPPTTRAAFTSATLVNTITADKLYPFPGMYGVFAGKCDSAKPPTAYFDATPSAQVLVGRGADSFAAGGGNVKVRQPPATIRVRRNTGGTTYVPVTNATVFITQTADAAGCADAYSGVTTNSTNSSSTALQGYFTKGTSRAVYDPGLPFGTWSICVQAVHPTDGKTYRTRRVAPTLSSGAPNTSAATSSFTNGADGTISLVAEPFNTSTSMGGAVGTC